MAAARLKARDARQQRDRAQVPHKVAIARASLSEAVASVPPRVRPTVEKALEQYERARDRELQAVVSELELYRMLGTVGTTVAVFAHESARPAEQIRQMAGSLRTRGRRELGERYEEVLAKPVELIIRATDALKTYTAIPLKLLRREKRRTGRVDVYAVLDDLLGLFEPFLRAYHIELRQDRVTGHPALRGTPSMLDSVLANLITNAIAALTDQDAPKRPRVLAVRTEAVRQRLQIRVLDSGPGIHRISVDEIWLPGRTTRVAGTGLGLTIVRDAVRDMGGRVSAIPTSDLGGAEFIVELPLLEPVQ